MEKDGKGQLSRRYAMEPIVTVFSFPDFVSSTAAPEIGILPSARDSLARSNASLTASMPARANSPSSQNSLTSR